MSGEWRYLVIGAVIAGVTQAVIGVPLTGSLIFAIGLITGMRSERARMIAEIRKLRGRP